MADSVRNIGGWEEASASQRRSFTARLRGGLQTRPGDTKHAKSAIAFVALVLFAGLMLLPFCWNLCVSFKPLEEVQANHWVPKTFQWENYLYVLGLRPPPGFGSKAFEIQFGRWYFNSFFIAAWVTLLQVTTSSFAAFAFSRLQWPGRDKLFVLYLGTMMIPGLVVSIPNFALMFNLGLYNTYSGLIIPAAFSAFGTFLLRQFMLGIPKSLDEAAEIDGASPFQIYWDLILPLTRPGLITLAIFTFIGNWGSFFWPLIMIKDEYVRTLPIGMLAFNSQYVQQTNLLMAGTLMTIIPPLVLFIVLQRYIVSGIQLGAVKG